MSEMTARRMEVLLPLGIEGFSDSPADDSDTVHIDAARRSMVSGILDGQRLPTGEAMAAIARPCKEQSSIGRRHFPPIHRICRRSSKTAPNPDLSLFARQPYGLWPRSHMASDFGKMGARCALVQYGTESTPRRRFLAATPLERAVPVHHESRGVLTIEGHKLTVAQI